MSESGPWNDPPAGPPSQLLPAPAALVQAGPPNGPGTSVNPSAEYWAHTAPANGRKKARGGRMKVTNIILLCLLGAVTLGTLAVFAISMGASVFLICGALALIPLTICILTLTWIDRWEPEPKSALVFAFCWGAGMSVVTALVLGSWVQPLLMAGNASADPDFVSAVIQAPLVEEISKGAGLLLIFFLRRRTFDGPIDGLVYAGMIAAGFAFTENILYFGQAWQENAGQPFGVVSIFVMRGLMSPFAHVMFTGALGVCVGYAARNGGTRMVLTAFAVGLVPAMFLHALWNGTTFLNANFFVIYAVLQVPIFIMGTIGIIFLRRAEASLTRRRLSDYVPSGWFTQAEVPMLATGAGRRRALTWARSFGAGATMKKFIALATRLAFTRQRLLVDAKDAPGSAAAAARFAQLQGRELELLNQATVTRSELLSQHSAATLRAQQQFQPHFPA